MFKKWHGLTQHTLETGFLSAPGTEDWYALSNEIIVIGDTTQKIISRIATLEQETKEGKDGEPGNQGEQGEQGKQGKDGSQGSQGEQGKQGRQGRQGRQGSSGSSGSQGKDGEPGKQGSQGKDGEPGKQGKDGSQGSSGKDGEPGNQGEQGEQGKQGKDGKSGEKGSPGSPGSPGSSGSSGSSGKNGEKGKDGEPGKNGEKGESGEQGKSGKPGKNGKQGSSGERGSQGFQGEKGKDGRLGSQGEKGSPGSQGKKGFQGEQGEQGKQGEKGKSGEQGYLGLQGKDGQSITLVVWKPNQKYYPNQLVLYENQLYYTTEPTITKPGRSSIWHLAVARGKRGAGGPKGSPGEPGNDLADYVPYVGATTDVDLNEKTLTNIADPVDNTDAVNLGYFNDNIITDHGDLNGLADDDHPQYHNDARAAAWLAANHETTYDHTDIWGAGAENQLWTQGVAGNPVSEADLTFNGTILKSPQYGAPANIILVPTGAGAIQAGITGDARGNYAVDLQMLRSFTSEVASGYCSIIGGGYRNKVTNSYSTIAGGYYNIIYGGYSTIAGGYYNKVYGNYSTIAGGYYNYISTGSDRSFIGGGYHNDITNDYATCCGGYYNDVTALYATVCGGSNNNARDTGVFVGGGRENDCSCYYGSVVGGASNNCYGRYSIVGGGTKNQVSADYAGIFTGNTVVIKANTGVALCGYNCEVSTDAIFGTIINGSGSVVSAPYGLVCGYQVAANNYGEHAQGSAVFTSKGSAQTSVLTASRQTTDSHSVNLQLDGSSIEEIMVGKNKSYLFEIRLVGHSTSHEVSISYRIYGCVSRWGGNAILKISTTELIHEDIHGTVADVTVGNDNMVIRVTGLADYTFNWMARIELTQVGK